MANESLLFSPQNPHFFKPLLAGFESHLNIPKKFFSDYIEGKHEGKIVKLRSDASDTEWEVKREDHKLTDGWKEFVEAHNLRVSDFVVFRHEGDLLFHVTALDQSCCEIQHTSYSSHIKEEEEETEEIETCSRFEEEDEKDLIAECDIFSIYVTAPNLSRDSVGMPKAFAERQGLYNKSQEIVLMNEERRKWPSELKIFAGSRRIFINRGWAQFCYANKLQAGDCCTFRLLRKDRNTEKPEFKLCRRTMAKEVKPEEQNFDEKNVETRFVKITPTPSSLNTGKQHLPIGFTRGNRFLKQGDIILVDKDNVEWSMKLNVDSRQCGLMYIMSTSGWRSFCATNDVSARETFTMELLGRGTTPVLKFCSKMEGSPFEGGRGKKRARVQARTKVEKIYEEGESSRPWTRAVKKSCVDEGNLDHTPPCSVSDQMAKVKQNVIDTLSIIRRFRHNLRTMKDKLKDSLQEINNLERRRQRE